VGLVGCDITDEKGKPRGSRVKYVYDSKRRAGSGTVMIDTEFKTD